MSTQCFAGKTVLITGASSGIGAGTAVEFAKKGANLVLGGRNAQQLDETKKHCIEAGLKDNQIVSVIGEIVEDKVQQNFVNAAIEKFGRIDVLVNNAGTCLNTPVTETKMDDFDRVHDVNVRSVVALTLKALPHLIKSKGNIVNISSIAATRQFENIFGYCMSKASLQMFTQCLAFEVAPQGVRVNSVNPGSIATNVMREMKQDPTKLDEKMKGVLAMHRIGRIGEVKEVADAILFLASDHATFITGQALFVAGGASIPGVAL